MTAVPVSAPAGSLVYPGVDLSGSRRDTDDRDARTDGALLGAVSRGDHRAFETLYHRHRDWVVNVAWRFTRDREAALDVMQETFAYLARKPPVLNGDVRLTTFLYTVVKHRAIDAQRRAAVRGANLPRGVEGAGLVSDAAESHAALRSAVDGLDEAHREVLLMRFVSGMSLAEIAGALGVALGTVKSRLHAAVKAVGERVGGGR